MADREGTAAGLADAIAARLYDTAIPRIGAGLGVALLDPVAGKVPTARNGPEVAVLLPLPVVVAAGTRDGVVIAAAGENVDCDRLMSLAPELLLLLLRLLPKKEAAALFGDGVAWNDRVVMVL